MRRCLSISSSSIRLMARRRVTTSRWNHTALLLRGKPWLTIKGSKLRKLRKLLRVKLYYQKCLRTLLQWWSASCRTCVELRCIADFTFLYQSRLYTPVRLVDSIRGSSAQHRRTARVEKSGGKEGTWEDTTARFVLISFRRWTV